MKNNILSTDSFKTENYALDAAELLRTTINELLQRKFNVSIALSGGSSPLPIYKALSRFDLAWDRISFFMVDERCVDISDPQSNYGNIKKCLLDSVSAKSFPMVTKPGNFRVQAKQYHKLLMSELRLHRGIPQIDLVLLGMGTDGHTASLFPNTKALSNTEDYVVLNNVPQLKTNRITMTYPLLQNANKIILLAKGKEKKAVLNNLDVNKHPIAKLLPQIFKIIN